MQERRFKESVMMLNTLAVLLQTSTSAAPAPMNVDNAPILSHMSEALHQSVNRVLSMLIAEIGRAHV